MQGPIPPVPVSPVKVRPWWLRWLPDLTTGDGIAVAGIFIGVLIAYGQYRSAERASALQTEQARISANLQTEQARLSAELQINQSRLTAEMQRQQNFVQISVGILSEKIPTDSEGNPQQYSEAQQSLRRWAFDTLLKNSPDVQIPEAAKEGLITGGVKLTTWSSSGSWGDPVSYTTYEYEPVYEDVPVYADMYQKPAGENPAPNEKPKGKLLVKKRVSGPPGKR